MGVMKETALVAYRAQITQNAHRAPRVEPVSDAEILQAAAKPLFEDVEGPEARIQRDQVAEDRTAWLTHLDLHLEALDRRLSGDARVQQEAVAEIVGGLAAAAGLAVGAKIGKAIYNRVGVDYIRDETPKTAAKLFDPLHKRVLALRDLVQRDVLVPEVKRKLESSQESLKKAEADLETRTNELEEAGEKLAKLESDLAAARRRLRGGALATKEGKLIGEINTAQGEVDSLRLIVQNVEGRVAAMRSSLKAYEKSLEGAEGTSVFSPGRLGSHSKKSREASRVMRDLVKKFERYKQAHLSVSGKWANGAEKAWTDAQDLVDDLDRTLKELAPDTTEAAHREFVLIHEDARQFKGAVEDAFRQTLWSSWRTAGLGGVPNAWKKFKKKWFGSNIPASRQEFERLTGGPSAPDPAAPETASGGRKKRKKGDRTHTFWDQ